MKNNYSESIKMRKAGKTTVLTVPKSIPITNQEYNVYQSRSGQIIYSPKRPNPFLESQFVETYHFPQTEAFDINHETSID